MTRENASMQMLSQAVGWLLLILPVLDLLHDYMIMSGKWNMLSIMVWLKLSSRSAALIEGKINVISDIFQLSSSLSLLRQTSRATMLITETTCNSKTKLAVFLF